MSRNKRIEEMEQIALMPCNEIKKIVEANCDEACSCWGCIARLFYAKGYRKASDVAEEIFADIEKIGKVDEPIVEYYILSYSELAELKKKYTESEKDDG